MSALRQEFISLSVEQGALSFGEFITKAGRLSPYFFNIGLFNDGATLRRLGEFYARTLLESGMEFDMLYGPAYKGIPLVSAVSMSLAELGHNVPFSFNRKEAKTHGEGGNIIGAPLQGRVIIVDDVVSAGISIGESVDFIRAAGATPAGVLIALDRMARSGPDDALSELSAVEEVKRRYGIPVISIANLDDLMTYLDQKGDESGLANYRKEIDAYRKRYGA